MFAKIALLNIIKHARRSAVVLLAVAISVAVLTFIGSLINGFERGFLDSILPTAGHLQVKDAGTKDAPNPLDLKYLIPNAEQELAQLNDPRIEAKEAILTFPAMLVQPVPTDSKKEAKNIGLMGQGVRPDTAFLQDVRKGIVAGSFLPDGQGIVLSQKVADLLDLKMGGTVMVLTQDRGNNPWYQELPITGIFRSGNGQTDQSLFVVSMTTAQELLDADGMAREFRFLLHDPDQSTAVAQALNPALRAAGLQVETWQQTFGSLLTLLGFVKAITTVVRLFFLVVAGSIITNTILQTVFERTREYGTLRAIGLKRRDLRGLIVTEGALLGVGGALVGLALAVPAVLILSRTGLDLGSATEYLGFSTYVYPSFTVFDAVLYGAAGLLVATLASLYAARVSARLSVTEALTHT